MCNPAFRSLDCVGRKANGPVFDDFSAAQDYPTRHGGRMTARLRRLAMAVAALTTVVASLTGAGDPRAEYQSLRTLYDTHSLLDAERGSEAHLEWVLERARTLYDRGLDFISTYATHPLRWDVLVLLQHVGHLQIVVRPDGSKIATQPANERERWALKYVGMLEDLLESSDASNEARHAALIQLIDHHCSAVRRGIVDNPRKGLVPALLEWVTEFHSLAPSSGKLAYLYLRVARMLNAIDPVRCRAFLQEKWALHSGRGQPDPDVRRNVENFQRLMRNQDEPADELWAHLQRIDPAVDITRYRGKVVLIAYLAVDWTTRTMELEKLYGQYHDVGLEIIQIAYENRGLEVVRVGSQSHTRQAPLVQRDKAAMERYAAERKWPWPVVWQMFTHYNSFERYWGLNSVPAYLVVRRDGRIAREIPGELGLDTTVARELQAGVP